MRYIIIKSIFTQKQRDKLAETGEALPDGSYPIRNKSDLKNAIQSIGRAKDYDKVKRHIIKRAKDLDLLNLLPSEWNESDKVNKTTDSEKQAKISKVMREFVAGKLRSSSGEVVTDKKQALAIAYSEAEKK